MTTPSGTNRGKLTLLEIEKRVLDMQFPYKAVVVVLLMLKASFAFGAESPYAEDVWLREGIALQIPKFKRTTFKPHPEREGVVAANCELDPSWWGRLCVFHQTAGKIDWIASEPASYQENYGHYVLSFEWRYLEKVRMWVLEVFESTHMGNGSLWLFALEERNLRELLHTTARGHFLKPPPDLIIPPGGETRLVEDHLSVEYRVADGDNVETVFLTGTIAAFDTDDKQQATKLFAETWKWDATRRIFRRLQP